MNRLGESKPEDTNEEKFLQDWIPWKGSGRRKEAESTGKFWRVVESGE
jgi:hypothetical protein